MQIKKRRGGWQFQTKYISLTHLPSSYWAPSSYANTSKYACLGRMTSLGGIPATPGEGMMSSVHVPATSKLDFYFVVILFPSIFISDNSPVVTAMDSMKTLTMHTPNDGIRCLWVGYSYTVYANASLHLMFVPFYLFPSSGSRQSGSACHWQTSVLPLWLMNRVQITYRYILN